jgi:hypothetical protein
MNLKIYNPLFLFSVKHIQNKTFTPKYFLFYLVEKFKSRSQSYDSYI